MVDLQTELAIDWMACELIEAVHGKASGNPVLRGTRMPSSMVRSWAIASNGRALNEPYAGNIGEDMGAPDTFEPRLLQPGMVFLLGDNRNHSLDSRLAEFGDVRLADIAGKATYIVSSRTGQPMNAIH